MRRRASPNSSDQLQLDFDAAPEPRRGLTPAEFLQALRQRRVNSVQEVRFKQNRARIITLGRDGRTLHIHACFQDAPDEVLDAVVGFLKAGRRTHAFRDAIAALRAFWTAKGQSGGWAVEEDESIIDGVRRLPSSGTRAQAEFLAMAYARFNARHFGGRLPFDFPIRISDKMASRFGHMRYHTMNDGTRIVLEIGINQNLFAQGREVDLLDTLLHEMTHVEAWLSYGHRAHGAQWKRIARRVGCEPRACSTKALRRRRRDAGPLTHVPHVSWLHQLGAA